MVVFILFIFISEHGTLFKVGFFYTNKFGMEAPYLFELIK